MTDAVVAVLEPVQKRYADLAADPAYVTAVFEAGSARCREVTAPVLAAAEAAIGAAMIERMGEPGAAAAS